MSPEYSDTRHKRVLFYVQHLLGIGHFQRALILARAMGRHGLDVYLVCGGILPGDFKDDLVQLIQLPPLRASRDNFSELLDTAGHAVSEQWKSERREILLGHLARIAPQVILVEAFPFGRRQMRFELEPLLNAALRMRPRPKILSSVRDVVQHRPRKRIDETVATIDRFFDGVLVHGDPGFIAFDASFDGAAAIQDRLVYTGYVSQPPEAAAPGQKTRQVVVSAGGGAVGDGLLLTAIQARPLSRLGDRPWRILTGPNLNPATRTRLMDLAGENVIVEPNRGDFAALLGGCSLSISQAGYNTVMDVLTAGVPAVLVPFAGDGETEQPLRAGRLRQLGIVQVVDEAELDPKTLATAVDRAVAAKKRPPNPIDMDGASTTADYLGGLLDLDHHG